ncbi:hypothetical protein CGCFRS4_v015642 [Colletotrichum fructicola]|nr:hypothetical protein CGCFRS4_v015642 [Colletotrichum fructicola]
MPLTSTLKALNGLANVIDRKAPSFAFEEWALNNVHEKVLAWATDDIYIDGNTTLKHEVLRRWKPSLEHLSTSLGVLAFLFDTEVIGSRSCCEALCKLCRTTPTLTLGALFARFVE